MKDEINLSECTEFEEVKAIKDDWMEYYNNERYQWQLAKLSPKEFNEFIRTGIYRSRSRTPPKKEDFISKLTPEEPAERDSE